MTETNTTETTIDDAHDKKTPSDARIVLGPLIKYALMGLALVSVIITTAVMLDRQLNDIDSELAAYQAEFAGANTGRMTRIEKVDTAEPAITKDMVVADVNEKATIKADANENTEADIPAAAIAVNQLEATAAIQPSAIQVVTEAAGVEPVVTETTANEASVTVIEHATIDPFDQSIEQIIAERNVQLKEMDRVYLKEYKASQDKQLQFMRERLTGQEQRLKDMEVRYQRRYEMRADNLKEMQELRENFMTGRI